MERLNDSGVQLTWFGGEGQRASDIVWCKGRPTSLQCQVRNLITMNISVRQMFLLYFYSYIQNVLDGYNLYL